jgi:hypothetical protein
MTSTTIAKAMIAERTTEELVTDFEVTNSTKMTVELSMVRGWLMDELEARNPDAFWAWIDSKDDSPRNYFC